MDIVAESLVKSRFVEYQSIRLFIKFSESRFLFFYIHNKKNGHSKRNPSKINGYSDFKKV